MKILITVAALATAAALSGCATGGLDLKEVNKSLASLNKTCDTHTTLHAEAHAGQLGGSVGGSFDLKQDCGPEIKANAKLLGAVVAPAAPAPAPPSTPPTPGD